MGGDVKPMGLSAVKKVGEKTGVYTTTKEKKAQETEKQGLAQQAIDAQSDAAKARDAEVRQRMNIFQTAGGSEGEEIYSTGKKRKLFSN
jgi:hypothetical protein